MLIALCLTCHAKVTRTLALDACWPPLLVQLWREQHPEAHEQLQLDFAMPFRTPVPVPLLKKKNHADLAAASRGDRNIAVTGGVEVRKSKPAFDK